MAQTQEVDRLPAWECIGCGRLEAERPCIGVCQDHKVELVYAADYDRLAAETAVLRAIVLEIATITPRTGECERTYQALQARARSALRGVAGKPEPKPM
ncbi:MAG TPA: hypothetical protein VFB54_09420 [Burkholderiales bacterium]|nr:hypothetical protein [Burkholderiales bacterium]